uniref:Mitochondrial carrier protein n=1 Tax=Phakopsora pachyrhizi TaxID=170000 RepID=A0A0S1MIK3_PHAPC
MEGPTTSTSYLVVDHRSILVYAIPAVTASVVSTLLTAPFDYVKTQLQLERIERSSSSSRNTITITTTSELIRRVLGARESQYGPGSITIDRRSLEKLRLFFNGSGLRLIRKGISSAIGWTIYEKLIKRWTTVPDR